MKKTMLRILAMSAAVALAGAAQAQGRHDEKPHGPPQKALKKSNVKQSNVAGRHDEKPHGPPAQVKPETDKK